LPDRAIPEKTTEFQESLKRADLNMENNVLPESVREDAGRATSAMPEENTRQHGPSSTSGSYCDIARQLLAGFGEAVQGLTRLHEQQFQCILKGDSNASRFDVLIHEANERKQNAKYAYLNHLQRHGCIGANEQNFDN
jgi:hypothetical protein